jgi:hypothetical protein
MGPLRDPDLPNGADFDPATLHDWTTCEPRPAEACDGALIGHFELFDEPLLDAMNVAVVLVRSPQSLAFLLEAAGAAALARCGAILDGWISAAEES